MTLLRPERRSLNGSAAGNLNDLLALRGIAARSASLSITPDTAMKHSVVNACVQMIANLAVLDVNATRDLDGRQVKSPNTPALLQEPSANVSPLEWRRQVYVAWLTRGTAFGMIAQYDQYGLPKQIELLPAEAITITTKGGSRLAGCQFKVDGQPVEPYPRGPLWVSRGLHTKTGVPVGISPIEMACGAIGLGLAAEEFGASWFYDGAMPSAILTTEKEMRDDNVARTLKARFLDSFTSGKRDIAVLGDGLKFQPITVAANESQFLETLDRNSTTVARFFLMPPNEVGASDGSSMTYNNAESRANALLARCFAPWLAVFESTMTALTLKPYTVRTEIDGLYRLDITTRTKVDGEDIRVGVRNRNEVRATRNLPPIDGGDEYVWPPYRAFPINTDGDPQPVPEQVKP